MICYLHYISAVRRLNEAEKTVTMLKGNKYSETDVPQMVLAQRDFIKLEKEYYGDVCIQWNFGLFFLSMMSFIGWVLYSVLFMKGA